MAETTPPSTDPERAGDRRGKDRRKADRRVDERRLPPPIWRRPWALVLYGVLGTLLLVMLVNRSRPVEQVPIAEDEVTSTPPPPVAATEVPATTTPGGTAEPARRMADHERLMAEGEAAKGRLVRVELFCSSINQVSLRSVERIESSIAELADTGGRVPAAECKWGPVRGAEPRADVLLLVPPGLAETFAAAPSVEDGFVRRRRIERDVEWVGRSEALALRTVVVMR
jgi:hypothetical protein